MDAISQAIAEIRKTVPDLELREMEPMSAHTSFQIGGPVRAMVLPASEAEAVAACRICQTYGVRPLLMGKGSNLLVPDRGLNRVVVKTYSCLNRLERTGAQEITCGSGVPLARLATFAKEQGLAGLEFAHGIPGTLGGAVIMNAGAYGGEIKDVVTETRCLGPDLEFQVLQGAAHDFSYRHSALSHSGALILASRLILVPGDPQEIGEKMADLAARRRASQPLDLPSAGSTFKRPATGYAAALIDQAGLKGYAVGGAQVSKKHAGFVVNRGGASFDDVLAVIAHVQEEVFRQFGIELEPEVEILRD